MHDWFAEFIANTMGKECGPGFSSRLWGGALRDETNNGCVGDYVVGGRSEKKIDLQSFDMFEKVQISLNRKVGRFIRERRR